MKDIKRDLPKGWRWVKLGDKTLITLIMGQSPPGESYNKEKIGLPFFQGKADFGNIYPDATVWCSTPKRIAEPNDILLSVRAPVGPTNIATEKCCIGRGLVAIRCKNGMFYKYLFLALRNFERHISSGGAGSIFNAIGKDEIKEIIFPLPPTLEDQIAIANDLEKKMAEVEAMRQAALRQKEAAAAMEGGILRDIFPVKSGEELPKGWRWVKLSSICEGVEYGYTASAKKSNVGPKLLRITDIQSGEICWDDVPYCECSESDRQKYKLRDGDIVFARTGSTGNTCLIKNPPEAVFASFLIRIKLDFELALPNFILKYLKSPLYWAIINNQMRGGIQKGFNATMLSNLEIPLPPTLEDQIAIANELERKMAEVDTVHQASDSQLEAIEAMPGAILREVFDFGKN